MPPQPQPGQNDSMPGSQPIPDTPGGAAPPVSPGPQAFGVPQSPMQSAPKPQEATMPQPNMPLVSPNPQDMASPELTPIVPQPSTPVDSLSQPDTPPLGPITGLQTSNPQTPSSSQTPRSGQSLPTGQPPTGQPPQQVSSNYATAPGNLSANTPSGAYVGSDGPQNPFTPQKFGLPSQKSKPGIKGVLSKKPVIALIIVALIGIGFAAFWFGYYNNPKVIYSQAMSNTNKGYERLVDYAKDQDSKNYKSTSGSGKFKLKSDSTNVSGTMEFKSSDNNSQFNLAVDLGVAKVNFDAIQLKTSKNASEYYLKVSGLKTVSSLASSQEFGNIISKTENTWIYVDPAMADLVMGSKAGSSEIKNPTSDQVLDAAAKIGEVNKKYLFTANQDTAVIKVEKNVGKEDVDGHSAYRYEVSIDDAHLKEYIKAQQAAIKSSKLYAWMKDNNLADTFNSVMDDAAKTSKDSTKDVKIEMWVDTKTRLIYKMRFSDSKSADNYSDIGLDYTGGSKYPMFITFNNKYDKDVTNAKFQITLDSESHEMNLSMKATSKGSTNDTFDADFTLKPGNETYKIDKPTNAKPLSQLLNELGYGDLIKQLQASKTSTQQDDTILQ